MPSTDTHFLRFGLLLIKLSLSQTFALRRRQMRYGTGDERRGEFIQCPDLKQRIDTAKSGPGCCVSKVTS